MRCIHDWEYFDYLIDGYSWATTCFYKLDPSYFLYAKNFNLDCKIRICKNCNKSQVQNLDYKNTFKERISKLVNFESNKKYIDYNSKDIQRYKTIKNLKL